MRFGFGHNSSHPSHIFEDAVKKWTKKIKWPRETEGKTRGKRGKKGKRNDWMTGEQRKKGEKQNGENQKR